MSSTERKSVISTPETDIISFIHEALAERHKTAQEKQQEAVLAAQAFERARTAFEHYRTFVWDNNALTPEDEIKEGGRISYGTAPKQEEQQPVIEGARPRIVQ